MSKKRAVDYQLSYVHKNRPYIKMDFIDKKGRVMMSSVDVLLNSEYFNNGDGDWDYVLLAGYVRTR